MQSRDEPLELRRNLKRVFSITVDCLRGNHIGCIGVGGLTPYTDKLAKESMVFTGAFSNGPGTNQSFPAILGANRNARIQRLLKKAIIRSIIL